MDQPVDALVAWLARQLRLPLSAFAEYGRRPQTMTDHARELAATLGLRVPTAADLPLMIEAAAQSAQGTDRGEPIAAGVITALRAGKIILPATLVIERTAIAGRARARRRAGDAPLAALSPEQMAKARYFSKCRRAVFLSRALILPLNLSCAGSRGLSLSAMNSPGIVLAPVRSRRQLALRAMREGQPSGRIAPPMKRDLDLIRAILLKLEEETVLDGTTYNFNLNTQNCRRPSPTARQCCHARSNGDCRRRGRQTPRNS
jgi:Domain of unknown function (DUF4158)